MVEFDGWNDYMDEVDHSGWMLLDIRETLHYCMVSILAEGELKDWCAGMENKGREHFFSEVFEGCEDHNVRLLARLAGQVHSTYRQLCAMNGIPEYTGDEDD